MYRLESQNIRLIPNLRATCECIRRRVRWPIDECPIRAEPGADHFAQRFARHARSIRDTKERVPESPEEDLQEQALSFHLLYRGGMRLLRGRDGGVPALSRKACGIAPGSVVDLPRNAAQHGHRRQGARN